MKVLSVNIAQVRDVVIAGKAKKTGIYKEPVSRPVTVTKEGLKGDNICNHKYHGGVDQAVYIYGSIDYDWWQKSLNREIVPGTFGENLTISNLESSTFSVGDRLLIDEVILEVSAPRAPCSTFANKMADPTFVKKFKNAERPGLYCRVIREGFISAGDQVTIKKYADPTISILEMFREEFDPVGTEEELRRYLAAPIAIRDRIKKEERLNKLLAD